MCDTALSFVAAHRGGRHLGVLYIRNLADGVAEQIRRSAAARSLTLSAYITALSNLHRAMLNPAANGYSAHALLYEHGLGRVED